MPNLTVSTNVDTMLGAADNAAIRSAIGLGQTDAPTFLAQSLTGQSLTGTQATSLVDLATTWNTTGTPTAIKLNVTNTASNPASLLMDLQVGLVSKASITKGGQIASGFGYTYAQPQFYDSSIGVAAGFQIRSASGVAAYGDGNAIWGVDSGATSGMRLGSILPLGWTSSHAVAGPPDVTLFRDAAGILAQRNGTAAQAFRVYNTYPGTGNNEFAEIAWTGNFMFVRPAISGGGTIRGSVFGSSSSETFIDGGTTNFRTAANIRWTINSSGHFVAGTDNTYDIGASGANRPKDIYASGMISSAGYTRSSAGYRFLAGGSYFVESSNGVLNLTDSSLAGFGRLQLGGTTSSFPAIKRNGTGIDIVLANDSGFAPLAASTIDAPFITSQISLSITAAAGGAGISIGCSRFRINGNTSSFPAFKNVGTRLDFILADDTGFTGIQSLYQRFGSGSPESVVTAPTGATYHRTDGGSGSSYYVKESGTGNTGWVGK